MSMLRHLIKYPPVLDDRLLEQALLALAKDARKLGEPFGVFESRIRREIGRPLHKVGWDNKDLTALQNKAKQIYLSVPADPAQEERWKQMYADGVRRNEELLSQRREIIQFEG